MIAEFPHTQLKQFGDFVAPASGRLLLVLAHFPATETSNVDVVARRAAFVVAPLSAQLKQVQFIDQPVALQQIERAIGGESYVGIDALRAPQNIVRARCAGMPFPSLAGAHGAVV